MRVAIILACITLCCAANMQEPRDGDSVKFKRLENLLRKLILKNSEQHRLVNNGISSRSSSPSQNQTTDATTLDSNELVTDSDSSTTKTSDYNGGAASAKESGTDETPSGNVDKSEGLDYVHDGNDGGKYMYGDIHGDYDTVEYSDDYDTLELDSSDNSWDDYDDDTEDEDDYDDNYLESEFRQRQPNYSQRRAQHLGNTPESHVADEDVSTENGAYEIDSDLDDDTLDDEIHGTAENADHVYDNSRIHAFGSRKLREKIERTLRTGNRDYSVYDNEISLEVGDSVSPEENLNAVDETVDNALHSTDSSKRQTDVSQTKRISPKRRQLKNHSPNDLGDFDTDFDYGDGEPNNYENQPLYYEAGGTDDEYDADFYSDYDGSNEEDLNKLGSSKRAEGENEFELPEIEQSIPMLHETASEDYDLTDSLEYHPHVYENSKQKESKQQSVKHIDEKSINSFEDESPDEDTNPEYYNDPPLESEEFEDVYSDTEIENAIDGYFSEDDDNDEETFSRSGGHFQVQAFHAPNHRKKQTSRALHDAALKESLKRIVTASTNSSEQIESANTTIFGYEELRDVMQMPDSDYIEDLLKKYFIDEKNKTIIPDVDPYECKSLLKKMYEEIPSRNVFVSDPGTLAMIYTRRLSAELLNKRMNGCRGAIVDRLLIRLVEDGMADRMTNAHQQLREDMLSHITFLSTLPYQLGNYSALILERKLLDYYYTQTLVYLLSARYPDVAEFAKNVHRHLKKMFTTHQNSNSSVTFDDLYKTVRFAFSLSHVYCRPKSEMLKAHEFAAKTLLQNHKKKGVDGITHQLKSILFDALVAPFSIPDVSALVIFTEFLKNFDLSSASRHVYSFGEKLMSDIGDLWQVMHSDVALQRLDRFCKPEEDEVLKAVESYLSINA